MIKQLVVLVPLLFSSSFIYSQFAPVQSFTSEWIVALTGRQNRFFAVGLDSYMATSVNECATVTNLVKPINNTIEAHQIDSNTIYIVSQVGSKTFVHLSTNAGTQWTQVLDSDTLIGNTFQLFDADNGILFCDQQNALVTDDAGVTWSKIYQPSYYPSKSAQYSDSIICVDDIFGIVYYSKDRGQNWQYGAGLPYLTGHHSLQLLNDTTIFSVLGAQFNKQYLSYSTNAGLTWHNKPSPMDNQADVVFNSFNEGYVVGIDSNLGCIFKTTDTGNTWTRYYSPNPTALTRMLFINDSIALVGATNGYLAKWNKNSLVLSVISEGIEKKPGISASPNPATAMQTIEINAPINSTIHCTLRDISGKLVMQVFNGTSTSGVVTQKVNLEELPSGVYMYEVQIDGSRSYHKIIKS
jgi:hypothetical protein